MSNILSVEIDNKTIKIIEGNKKGKTLSVCKCINAEITDGVTDDGEIKDMDKLEEMIKNKLIQHGIKAKRAHLLINSNSIIIRSIVLPYISNGKETKSMIKFELGHLMSADLNLYKIVYKQEEIFIKDGIKKVKYAVNLLQKKIYDEYLELFKRLKLQLISFDGSFNNLIKITSKKINNEIISNISTLAFARLSYDSITLSVIKNSVVNFSKISYLNPDEQLEIERASESMQDSEQFKVFMQDEIKRKDDYLNFLFDEISKYLRYFSTINKDSNIEKIYIYGYGCSKSMAELLSSELNINIEMIEELDEIVITDEGLFENFENNKSFYYNEYLNLILSFYLDNKDVNFLTDAIKKHLMLFNTGVSLMAVVLILVLIFIYNELNYFLSTRYLLKEIGSMNTFIHNEKNEKLNLYSESLETNILKLENYKKNAVKLNELIAGEDLISSNMFDEIKAALPSNTLIRSVIIDKNSLQLICTSSSLNDISLVEYSLKNLNFLDTVHIPSIESQNSSDNTAIYLYSAVCRLRGVSDETE